MSLILDILSGFQKFLVMILLVSIEIRDPSNMILRSDVISESLTRSVSSNTTVAWAFDTTSLINRWNEVYICTSPNGRAISVRSSSDLH